AQRKHSTISHSSRRKTIFRSIAPHSGQGRIFAPAEFGSAHIVAKSPKDQRYYQAKICAAASSLESLTGDPMRRIFNAHPLEKVRTQAEGPGIEMSQRELVWRISVADIALF